MSSVRWYGNTTTTFPLFLGRVLFIWINHFHTLQQKKHRIFYGKLWPSYLVTTHYGSVWNSSEPHMANIILGRPLLWEQGAEEMERKIGLIWNSLCSVFLAFFFLFYFFVAESSSSLRPVASVLFCANISIKQVDCWHGAIPQSHNSETTRGVTLLDGRVGTSR